MGTKAETFQAKVVFRSPESLTPYLNNAKNHSTEQIDAIAGLIAASGFDVPIVVDKHGVIIKGHGRREASLRLGLKSVPVIVRDDLDEHQAIAMRIADNRVAEGQSYDKDKLAFDVGTLARNDFDLNLLAMKSSDLDLLLKAGEIALVSAQRHSPAPAPLSLGEEPGQGAVLESRPEVSEDDEDGLLNPAIPDEKQEHATPNLVVAYGRYKFPMMPEVAAALEAKADAWAEENGTYHGFIASLLG